MNPFIFTIILDLKIQQTPKRWYSFVILEMPDQRFFNVVQIYQTQFIQISRGIYLNLTNICNNEF